MSIAYFPEIYEDELVYSTLSRFYVHGGYLHYKDAGKELFYKVQGSVDKEFVKWIKSAIVELLTKHMTFEELLERHTMYPFYGRFIDSDRRNKAFQALMAMDGDFSKLFGAPQPRKGKHRYMRYCPLCVGDDRKKYGETYWHRIHQLADIDLCAVHGCYLVDSSVSLCMRENVCLVSAEEVMPSGEVLQGSTVYSSCPVEVKLAQYTAEVFQQPIDRRNTVMVKDFLHSRMMGTPYMSSRGAQRYFNVLWEDMRVFYQGVPLMDILTDRRMERLLRGDRIIFSEICMVAMFLGVSVEELARMKKPSKAPEQIFDERVKALLDSGMTVREIAKEMGVDSGLVKISIRITEQGDREKKFSTAGRSSPRAMDWGALDRQMLPLVRQAVAELLNDTANKPQKISLNAVSRKLAFPESRMARMEQCRTEIEQHVESIERYRARKTIWAVNTLKREGKPLIRWRVLSIVHLTTEQLQLCLPHLKEMSPDIYELVIALM